MFALTHTHAASSAARPTSIYLPTIFVHPPSAAGCAHRAANLRARARAFSLPLSLFLSIRIDSTILRACDQSSRLPSRAHPARGSTRRNSHFTSRGAKPRSRPTASARRVARTGVVRRGCDAEMRPPAIPSRMYVRLGIYRRSLARSLPRASPFLPRSFASLITSPSPRARGTNDGTKLVANRVIRCNNTVSGVQQVSRGRFPHRLTIIRRGGREGGRGSRVRCLDVATKVAILFILLPLPPLSFLPC